MQAATSRVQQAWDALDAVPDPEIPVVSIRELGILRDVREDDAGLEIVITPTYSGCPAMDQIADDIHAALAQRQLSARITTQLAPAWTTDWITDTAKAKLHSYGIAPPHTLAPGSDRVVRFAPRLAASDAVACPLCGSANTTETSHFGSTACKALYKCLDCLEPFDHFKPY
ncbi:MAG: 1,2-phenylacetyl-CoA epoxidase subunit PaaD [Polaromonas sp.]|uniref:1,2-phenylacetyl-CoA epoxidase subunit PaaD n=1 Tax=Polaromonas sp. TaxID=1869339 RepID=UPI004036A0E4